MKKMVFICDKCKRKFSSIVNNVSKGEWCPHCKHKTEMILLQYIESIFPEVKTQVSFPWCLTEKQNVCRFDFQVGQVLIELDGPQHFVDMPGWYSLSKDVLERDIHKMKCSIDNGYFIVRICQADVWNELIDWKTPLIEFIKQPTDNIIYIAANSDLYNKHKQISL
jgi:DNA-directed RNA polymerase subunit RPC12/RpoP